MITKELRGITRKNEENNKTRGDNSVACFATTLISMKLVGDVRVSLGQNNKPNRTYLQTTYLSNCSTSMALARQKQDTNWAPQPLKQKANNGHSGNKPQMVRKAKVRSEALEREHERPYM